MCADPTRIGRSALRLLESEPTVWYSSISMAELQMKQSQGKLSLAPNLVQQLGLLGVDHHSFGVEHASEIQRFGTLTGHDPFDRMILAHAAGEGARLLTADRKLLAVGLPWVVDAHQ